ncbi:hypothetical protein VTN00DRAFT_3438 [Thermoascus crustaceus]|uniref:uncharacterized protein n=1 Tax=Thermoascus crustaceus TaxID=5088 RepID=UPI003743A519
MRIYPDLVRENTYERELIRPSLREAWRIRERQQTESFRLNVVLFQMMTFNAGSSHRDSGRRVTRALRLDPPASMARAYLDALEMLSQQICWNDADSIFIYM